MSPLATAIITLTAQYGLPLVEKLITIANKPDATVEDWQALFDENRGKRVDDYVNEERARRDAKAA